MQVTQAEYDEKQKKNDIQQGREYHLKGKCHQNVNKM